MAIPASVTAPSIHGAWANRLQQICWYEMYGLWVRSDFPLPFAPAQPPPTAAPDVVVARAAAGRSLPPPDGPLIARTPCLEHGVDTTVHRGPGGTWIWQFDAGTFHFRSKDGRVDVYPDPGADERSIGVALAWLVMTQLINERGVLSLHSSAVMTDYGVAAFLGPGGYGKSTMTAYFVRRGALFQADDVLIVRPERHAVCTVPSPPYMKLWPESIEGTLDLSDNFPSLQPVYGKKLLAAEGRYGVAREVMPIRGIYVLNRYVPSAEIGEGIEIRPLDPRDGLTSLLTHLSGGFCLYPGEIAGFLPILARLGTQAPVCVLRYPTGFAHQARVYEAVMADLAAKEAGR